jgi:hypothetical protein
MIFLIKTVRCSKPYCIYIKIIIIIITIISIIIIFSSSSSNSSIGNNTRSRNKT